MHGCNNQSSRNKNHLGHQSQTLSDGIGVTKTAPKSHTPVKRGCCLAVSGIRVTSEGKSGWSVVGRWSRGRTARFQGGPSVANQRGLNCHQEEASVSEDSRDDFEQCFSLSDRNW